MKNKILRIGIILCGALAFFSGCASTPDKEGDEVAVSGINDNSFDVLFATEFPVDSEADAIARATQALKEDEVEKALFFYVRALQFRPDNVALLAHIGEVQMQRNNLTMAKRAFLSAKSYDPKHAKSLESLGLIYLTEEKHDQAKIELQAALMSDSQLWRSHNALGVYADKDGDFAAAQRHYNAALSINPKAAQILNNRGYSKFLAGDYFGAAMDLNEAANDGKFAQAWVNLGRVYAAQSWYENALAAFKHVMNDEDALNTTGSIAIENGDLDEAERFLQQAVHRSPTYFPAAEKNLAILANMR